MSAPYLWSYKCAASGCNSNGKERKLFRFPHGQGPASKIRVQKWIDCAQNSKVNPTHAYMCEFHFNNKQFRDADRTLLIYGAVPTIQLENGVYVDTAPPPEAKPVQPLKDASIQHPEDVSLQQSEDTSVQHHEDISVENVLADSLLVPSEDSPVEICMENFPKETLNPNTFLGGDGFDHIYAKNLEPIKRRPHNGRNATHNVSTIKRASFTVYVITPKPGGGVSTSTSNMKHKHSDKRKNSSEQDFDVDSFLHNVKCDNSVSETAPVLDTHCSAPQEASRLPNLHSRTSCKQMTPREKKLIVLVSKKIRPLRQIVQKYENLNMTLSRLCDLNNDPVEEVDSFSKTMSLASARFLASRVFYRKKPPAGKKWSLNEVMYALVLYKRLPKCYTILTTMFALPSEKILENTLAKITWLPGLNNHILNALASTALGTMDTRDSMCVLLFDEMPIEECLRYDSRTDSIVGFEDWGHLGKRDKIGSHALVFMLKGLYSKWRQPVMFYFTGRHFSVELLRSVLQTCWRVHLNVVATVCNMNVNNVRMLKRLGATEDKPFFYLGGSVVVTLYNPPHLLKGLRNLLFENDILVKHDLTGKTTVSKASWSVIREAYNIDSQTTFRILIRLTDRHLEPREQDLEKLSVAAQVLSHTMAAAIYSFVSGGLLDSNALATAHFVSFCNKLFHSVNNRTDVSPEGITLMRQPHEAREEMHVQFWDEGTKELEQWEVVRNSSAESGSGSKPAVGFRPSCLSGWITTLRGLKFLWTMLNEIGFENVELRGLNLDLVEELFSSVRTNSKSKTNPTASQFLSALKTSMIKESYVVIDKSYYGEEENDPHKLLIDFQDLIEACSSKNVSPGLLKAFDQVNGKFSLAHIADCVAKKIDDDIKCNECKQVLQATSDEYVVSAVIFKGYSDHCPSEQLLRCVAHASRVLEEVLPKVAHTGKVQSRVVSAMKDCVSFEWLKKGCKTHAEHIQNEVLSAVCCALIPQWCRRRIH